MALTLTVFGVVAARGGAAEERLVLPSGLQARLQEVIRQDGPVARFRYVAPGFGGQAPLEEIAADLAYLCETHAAPRLRAEEGDAGARVVVSLADRASEFGVYDPEVVQVFEAYRLKGDGCIWEAF